MKEFIKSSALVVCCTPGYKKNKKLKKQPKQKYCTSVSVSVWFGQQNVLSRHIHYANLKYTTVWYKKKIYFKRLISCMLLCCMWHNEMQIYGEKTQQKKWNGSLCIHCFDQLSIRLTFILTSIEYKFSLKSAYIMPCQRHLYCQNNCVFVPVAIVL